MNAAQKRWLMEMGVLPLGSNERTRASWAWLVEAVGEFPINQPAVCTRVALAPYFEKARAAQHQLFELATVDEEDEDEDNEDPHPTPLMRVVDEWGSDTYWGQYS